MVRIVSSFIGAAIAFSSFVSAAPAIHRRQGDINVVVPAAAGQEGLNTIDPNVIPSVDVNGSLGNSVDIPSETAPPVVIETPPPVVIETPPVVDTPPPVVQTSVTTIIQSIPPVVHQPSWPVYGSGSGGWQIGYQDCMQQCVVSHQMPATVVVIPPQGHQVSLPSGGDVALPPSGGSVVTPQVGGTGVTHDIIIEAAAGVLRAAPSFVKANQGDVVRFVIANGQHQILESSVLAPCNATVGGFDSGVKAAGQTFEFTVTDAAPRFFYSNGECTKGLFGGINAETGNEASETTVSALMPKWAESNADIAAALDATNKLSAQTPGLNWGNAIEVKDIPSELHGQLAESVLFTRAMIGRNPEMVDATGQFNPTNEVVVPVDFATLISVANAGGYPASDVSGAGEAPAPVAVNAAAGPADTPSTDGAGSILSSRAAYAAVALVGALFMF